MDGDAVTLDQALGLLSLPRTIGLHPETKQPIDVGIGRFGPYVRMAAIYGSLERDDDVLSLGMNRAMDLLAKKLASVRSLGEHPADKQPVSVRKGRFGPYAQHGKTVANLPRGVMMDDITLEQAVALLAEKGKQLRPRGAGGRRGRGAAAKAAAPAGRARGGAARNGAGTPPADAAAPASSGTDARMAAAASKAGRAAAAVAKPRKAKAPARRAASPKRAAAQRSAKPAVAKKAPAPANKPAAKKQAAKKPRTATKPSPRGARR